MFLKNSKKSFLSTLLKKSEAMKVDTFNEEAVTVKKMARKTTSTTKLPQTTRSQLNIVDEEAPKANSLVTASASVAIASKLAEAPNKLAQQKKKTASTSELKLTKAKKQSCLQDELQKAKPMMHSSDSSDNDCIIIDDSDSETKSASKPRTISAASLSAQPRAATTSAKEKESKAERNIVSKSPIVEQIKRPQRQSALKSSKSDFSDLYDRNNNNLSTASGLVSGSKSKAALSVLKNNKDNKEVNESALVEETKTKIVPIQKKK
jgi:hypothetical protein